MKNLLFHDPRAFVHRRLGIGMVGAVDNNTVQLALSPLKVGTVTVTGDQFMSDDNTRRALPQLKGGATPDLKSLSRGLSPANDHPIRHLSLNLKESAAPDTIDVEIQVKDARPWSVLTNLSNIGTKDLARLRLSVGRRPEQLGRVRSRRGTGMSGWRLTEATARVGFAQRTKKIPLAPAQLPPVPFRQIRISL